MHARQGLYSPRERGVGVGRGVREGPSVLSSLKAVREAQQMPGGKALDQWDGMYKGPEAGAASTGGGGARSHGALWSRKNLAQSWGVLTSPRIRCGRVTLSLICRGSFWLPFEGGRDCRGKVGAPSVPTGKARLAPGDRSPHNSSVGHQQFPVLQASVPAVARHR